jgi:hypothetical protein
MLHDLLGAALICTGALTIIARILARSNEQRRRPVRQPVFRASEHRRRR